MDLESIRRQFRKSKLTQKMALLEDAGQSNTKMMGMIEFKETKTK